MREPFEWICIIWGLRLNVDPVNWGIPWWFFVITWRWFRLMFNMKIWKCINDPLVSSNMAGESNNLSSISMILPMHILDQVPDYVSSNLLEHLNFYVWIDHSHISWPGIPGRGFSETGGFFDTESTKPVGSSRCRCQIFHSRSWFMVSKWGLIMHLECWL